MMKKIISITTLCVLFLLVSCNNENSPTLIDFSVSFQNESSSFLESDSNINLNLAFSRTASEDGTIQINISNENATYGIDYTTSPEAVSGVITIPVTSGDDNAIISITKLTDPIEGTTRNIDFSISSLEQTDWVIGSIESSTLGFTPVASKGSIIDLLTGGSTQPNQSYIDLSTGIQTVVKRDTWEIAVYNGNENKVFLNASLLVAAAEIVGETDLLSITETSDLSTSLTLNSFGAPTTVTRVSDLITNLPVSYSQFSNVDEDLIFTDLAAGNLEGTAFSDISTTESENYVYIISLGNEIPTEEAEAGSINTTGDHRGFMKVRVLTDGNTYTIQYADLNETSSYKEATITKDSNKLLSAFSLTNETEVDVEPNTTEWDINFSGVFSFNSDGFGLTYSDYCVHNTLGNVGLYQVTSYEVNSEGVRTDFDVPSYTEFTIDDLNEPELIYDNRIVIGSGWRSFSQGIAKDDRYFIIKDADANTYKLRFTALLNSEGERGYSQFEYSKL